MKIEIIVTKIGAVFPLFSCTALSWFEFEEPLDVVTSLQPFDRGTVLGKTDITDIVERLRLAGRDFLDSLSG